jgi:hypothetical protein
MKSKKKIIKKIKKLIKLNFKKNSTLSEQFRNHIEKS